MSRVDDPPAAGIRRCEGVTKSGRLCRAEATRGSHFCVYHDPHQTLRTKWDVVTGRPGTPGKDYDAGAEGGES